MQVSNIDFERLNISCIGIVVMKNDLIAEKNIIKKSD